MRELHYDFHPLPKAGASPPPIFGRVLDVIAALWGVYFLFATTTGFFWLDSWHNEQRAVQIILLILTAVVCAGLRLKTDATHFPTPSRLVFIFFAAGLVSATLSQYRLASFAEVSWFLLLATLIMSSAAFFSQKIADPIARINRLVWLIAITHVAGISVQIFASLKLFGSVEPSAFVLGFANPRFESALHVLILPTLISVAANHSAPAGTRSGSLILASLLVSINCALGTRAFWFAYIVAIPVLVFSVSWKRARSFVLTLGLTFLAGILMYVLLLKVNTAIAPSTGTLPSPTDRITLNRTELWSKAWSDFRTSPLLGIGPYQFASWPNRFGSHPHNWVLQLLSEWGFLGTAALMCAAATVFTRFGKNIRQEGDSDSREKWLAIFVACIASLAHGLVDGNLVMPISQSFTAIMIGIAVVQSTLASPKLDQRANSLRQKIFFLAAVLTCAVVVLIFAKDSFSKQQSTVESFHRRYPDVLLLPRFWGQGLLSLPAK